MKHSPPATRSPPIRRRKRTIGRPSIKPILEKHNFTVEFLHPLIKILANLAYCCNSPPLDPPLLAPSASLSDCFLNLYNLIYTYLAIFNLWCVVQCTFHLSVRVSMPQNGSQHLYFIKTLSLGMKQIQIEVPQNGYSAQKLGKF